MTESVNLIIAWAHLLKNNDLCIIAQSDYSFPKGNIFHSKSALVPTIKPIQLEHAAVYLSSGRVSLPLSSASPWASFHSTQRSASYDPVRWSASALRQGERGGQDEPEQGSPASEDTKFKHTSSAITPKVSSSPQGPVSLVR